jgi:hypothetical protein
MYKTCYIYTAVSFVEIAVSSKLDTSSIQVTPISIHPGSAITQLQRRLVRRQQYGSRQPYDKGQKKLLIPHFSIRFAGTTQVQYGIWGKLIHQFFSATRGRHKNVQRDSHVQPREEKYSPTHHSTSYMENSWTHHGEANVMASRHCHLCDAPICGWACIFITVLLTSTTMISTGPTVLPWLGSSQG